MDGGQHRVPGLRLRHDLACHRRPDRQAAVQRRCGVHARLCADAPAQGCRRHRRIRQGRRARSSEFRGAGPSRPGARRSGRHGPGPRRHRRRARYRRREPGGAGLQGPDPAARRQGERGPGAARRRRVPRPRLRLAAAGQGDGAGRPGPPRGGRGRRRKGRRDSTPTIRRSMRFGRASGSTAATRKARWPTWTRLCRWAARIRS